MRNVFLAATPNATTIFNNIENDVLNFPVEYAYQTKSFHGTKCGRFPSIFNVQFINTHWQVFNHSNGSFSLLNAYYDGRVALDSPTIRISVAVKRVRPRHNVTCQLWFEHLAEPVLSPVFEYRYLWREVWGLQDEKLFHSYLMACKIPIEHKDKVPKAISLVENPCDFAINLLKVHNNRPPSGVKQKFGVCMKQLNFLHQDMSLILVEWLEVLFSMGVEKVHIYNMTAHPNMLKVLQYYEEQGKVELRPITLPGFQPNIINFYDSYFKDNLQKQVLFETILFNDCFYRNLYNFEWLAVIDIDELIMPVANYTSWNDIWQQVDRNPKIEGYGFRNIYFFDNNTYFNVSHDHQVAPFLPFSNLVHRAKNHNKLQDSTKSWFSTERVVTLHNHYAISCIKSDYCNWHEVSPDIAQLQHYCFNKKDQNYCTTFENNTVIDTNIWKFKDEITNRTIETMEHLNFIDRNL